MKIRELFEYFLDDPKQKKIYDELKGKEVDELRKMVQDATNRTDLRGASKITLIQILIKDRLGK